MEVLERCKACYIYQSYNGSICCFIEYKIPHICPCYDCIVITTCRIDCKNYLSIVKNLNNIKENAKNEVLKFLEENFGVNSLGPKGEKT
jgi:hypothetical protein